jgi:hypothetical protein
MTRKSPEAGNTHKYYDLLRGNPIAVYFCCTFKETISMTPFLRSGVGSPKRASH